MLGGLSALYGIVQAVVATDLLTRVALNTPYALDPDIAQQVTAELSAT